MSAAAELPREIATRLREARRWFVLTGAGISAESGVPTFRGPGGLWEGSRPEELASPEGFRADPLRVWRWYRWRRSVVAAAAPNAGHYALVALERARPGFCLATQNVDGLHARAGSARVCELHGSIHRSRCSASCGRECVEPPGEELPRCPCGSLLRPDVVWFGESLDEEILREVFTEAERCDACLVVGTSALVVPAAALPLTARRAGAIVIEVNPEETALSSSCEAVLRGPAAQLLPAFLQAIGIEVEPAARSGV